jgi:hypothetical protein
MCFAPSNRGKPVADTASSGEEWNLAGEFCRCSIKNVKIPFASSFIIGQK